MSASAIQGPHVRLSNIVEEGAERPQESQKREAFAVRLCLLRMSEAAPISVTGMPKHELNKCNNDGHAE